MRERRGYSHSTLFSSHPAAPQVQIAKRQTEARVRPKNEFERAATLRVQSEDLRTKQVLIQSRTWFLRACFGVHLML